jgi:hypothetical protein
MSESRSSIEQSSRNETDAVNNVRVLQGAEASVDSLPIAFLQKEADEMSVRFL